MTEQRTLSRRAWIELGGLALIWGGSFVSVRVALDEIEVASVVGHRVFWAATALWLYTAIRRLPLPRDPRIWGALFVMGALNNVIPFSLMAWGQLHIESGLAAIFNAATAFFGILVAAAVFADERLTTRRLAGVGLGTVGVAIAIGPQALLSFDPRAMGQMAVLAGTVSYAFAGAWGRARLGTLRPEVAALGMLTGSAAIMTPAALIVDGPPDLTLSVTTWVAIGYFSLVATAGAYLVYYRVLAMAGSGNLLLVTLLVPPVAIVLGALVRGERLEPSAYAGFACLATGLTILNRRPLPKAGGAR